MRSIAVLHIFLGRSVSSQRWVCNLVASYRPRRPERSKNKSNSGNKDCCKCRDVGMCQCPYQKRTQGND